MQLEAGSQYDAGGVSVISVVKIAEESSFIQSNSIPNVKFLDNLISWMLTNTGEVTLELNLSQLQHHANVHDTMLVPASYCEPVFVSAEHWTLFDSSYHMCFLSHIELHTIT